MASLGETIGMENKQAETTPRGDRGPKERTLVKETERKALYARISELETSRYTPILSGVYAGFSDTRGGAFRTSTWRDCATAFDVAD